jgi:hypothetical protein
MCRLTRCKHYVFRYCKMLKQSPSRLEWLPSTSAGGGWLGTYSGAGLDDLWTSPGAGLSPNLKNRGPWTNSPTPRCYMWLALIRAEGVHGTWEMCL